MIKLKKFLKEESAQIISPTGDDDLSKAIRVREAIKHKIFSLTLEDVLRDPTTVERINNSIDQAESALSKIVDKLLDSDQEKLADQIDACNAELIVLGNFTYAIQTAAEKAQESYENLNYKI